MLERKSKPNESLNIEPFKRDTSNAKRMQKRWKTAKVMPSGCVEKVRNELVEGFYFQILKLAKSLHIDCMDSQKPVYEKDSKEDNTYNSFTMHTFLTPNFFIELECDFAYYFRIEYDFYNCPFEGQIMQSIANKLPFVSNAFKRVHKQPNLREFHKRVLEVQDKEFVYILNKDSSNLLKLAET